MANDLNQCNFIGRLGQDPESRFTQDSTQVVNISLAVGWKSKEKEGTEWVRCVAFGKLAEIMAQYLRKGSKVFISGSYRTRKWQNQQGQDQYSTEIVISDMQMLDGKPQGNQTQHQQQQPQQQNQGFQNQGFQGQQQGQGFGTNSQQPNPQNSGAPQPSNEFDDDLPF